jgi:hypothetical protein
MMEYGWFTRYMMHNEQRLGEYPLRKSCHSKRLEQRTSLN